MGEAVSTMSSPTAVHIVQTMIGRFGNNSLAIAEALELRCAASGQTERAELMKAVRQILSGTHLIDVWA